MKTAVLILHMIFALALVGVVLIQRSEGGGLGLGSGNLGGLMTTRGTSNLLTRITAILAAIFFINTIVLALLFKGESKPKSILDTPAASSAPMAPVTPVAPVSTESSAKGDAPVSTADVKKDDAAASDNSAGTSDSSKK